MPYKINDVVFVKTPPLSVHEPLRSAIVGKSGVVIGVDYSAKRELTLVVEGKLTVTVWIQRVRKSSSAEARVARFLYNLHARERVQEGR